MTARHVTFPSGRLLLEGVLHLPDRPRVTPGVVVCHPHPQYGGDMDSNVVLAVCDAMAAKGWGLPSASTSVALARAPVRSLGV